MTRVTPVTPARPLDRIALVSDVHGNLTALEAVLADIDARGITRIFNLGDYVGKGPRGQAAVDRCREVCEVNILGNWDDLLPDPDRVHDREALRWWKNELREDQWAWLRALLFSHDFLMSEISPAAAGDGSRSRSVMIPRSRGRGGPRTGTATSSFPRKLATPLFGAIASPMPARTKPSIVANWETVTT